MASGRRLEMKRAETVWVRLGTSCVKHPGRKSGYVSTSRKMLLVLQIGEIFERIVHFVKQA